MKNMLRELLATIKHPVRRVILRGVYKELSRLEYHSVNRRMYAIEQCTEYLIGAQIDGDYAEFGVYKGDTLSHAHKWMAYHFAKMKFHAFDSFEGLPKPTGMDAANSYSSHFYETQFCCSEQDFRKNLIRKDVDLNRVSIVKGWFDKSLTSEAATSIGLKKVALAWIDCDLYESTIPVLNFLTPLLTEGSIVIFDDWRCYRNLPGYGEQRACSEWLERNPRLQLRELFSFGWNGIAFTVSIRDGL